MATPFQSPLALSWAPGIRRLFLALEEFMLFCGHGGHIQRCSVYSWPCIRGSLLMELRDPLGYWGSNPDQMHARQVPYPIGGSRGFPGLVSLTYENKGRTGGKNRLKPLPHCLPWAPTRCVGTYLSSHCHLPYLGREGSVGTYRSS